jgi:hypothetical protein
VVGSDNFARGIQAHELISMALVLREIYGFYHHGFVNLKGLLIRKKFFDYQAAKLCFQIRVPRITS